MNANNLPNLKRIRRNKNRISILMSKEQNISEQISQIDSLISEYDKRINQLKIIIDSYTLELNGLKKHKERLQSEIKTNKQSQSNKLILKKRHRNNSNGKPNGNPKSNSNAMVTNI